MKPKNNNMVTPILYGIIIVFCLFCGLHSAVIFEEIEIMIATQQIEKDQRFIQWLGILLDRITFYPFAFYFNDKTLKTVAYGGAFAIVIISLIEKSKRNYIHGKEFGDASWGTKKDIQELFAANIEKENISRAKVNSTERGRRKSRKKLFAECERDGRTALKADLKEIKEATDREILEMAQAELIGRGVIKEYKNGQIEEGGGNE